MTPGRPSAFDAVGARLKAALGRNQTGFGLQATGTTEERLGE